MKSTIKSLIVFFKINRIFCWVEHLEHVMNDWKVSQIYSDFFEISRIFNCNKIQTDFINISVYLAVAIIIVCLIFNNNCIGILVTERFLFCRISEVRHFELGIMQFFFPSQTFTTNVIQRTLLFPYSIWLGYCYSCTNLFK